MEFQSMVLICVLAFCVLALLVYLLSLRHSIREAAEELEEKLRTDTNTLISISTGDKAVRALATQINRQLQALRRERLRLQTGSDELTTAVTNISHDLRTPLTAICGYLDLLEREPQSEKAARFRQHSEQRGQILGRRSGRQPAAGRIGHFFKQRAAPQPCAGRASVRPVLYGGGSPKFHGPGVVYRQAAGRKDERHDHGGL